MTERTYDDIAASLAAPFAPEVIQWKPGVVAKDKSRALALPYVDIRDYIRRLNQAAGADWQDSYQVEVAGNRLIVICRLTVARICRTGDGECDLGDPNAMTSASAQAFKRACVKHGLGARLYDMPKVWADYDKVRKAFTDRALVDLLARASGQGEAGPRHAQPTPQGTTPPAEAGEDIEVRFGKYRGKTVREIAALDPAYLEWLTKNWQWEVGRRAAATVLAEHRAPAVPRDSDAPSPAPDP
jgi:hypothetical protein